MSKISIEQAVHNRRRKRRLELIGAAAFAALVLLLVDAGCCCCSVLMFSLSMLWMLGIHVVVMVGQSISTGMSRQNRCCCFVRSDGYSRMTVPTNYEL